MKTITLVAALLFVTLLSNAQITKGSTLIGGSIGASANEEGDEQNIESKNSQWNAGIQLGTFVANNKAFGLYINYYNSHQEREYPAPFLPNNSETNGNGYGGGLFYRQYFPLSAKWYLFGEAGLGYHEQVTKSEYNNNLDSKSNGWSTNLYITPGISFAVGRRLFVESSFNSLFSLYYSKSKTEDYNLSGNVANTVKSKSFGTQANISGLSDIQFGLRWILPGKTK